MALCAALWWVVSIPSFKDPSVVQTVVSCLERAVKPERVAIVVCEQNDDEPSAATLVEWAESLGAFLFVETIPHTEAQGPCYARARIEAHIKRLVGAKTIGCDWVVMIDAHTLFAPRWDERLERQVAMLPANGVLSCYPRSYMRTAEGPVWNEDSRRVLMELNGTDPNGLLLFKSVAEPVLARASSRPDDLVLSKGLGACFLVVRLGVLYEVPYLKNVPYLFIGEEMATWCRLFMAGYDVFTPAQEIVQTTFRREGRANFHGMTKKEANQAIIQQRQVEKIKAFMGLATHKRCSERDLDEFGRDNVPGVVLRS
jgi:hypothetical protein